MSTDTEKKKNGRKTANVSRRNSDKAGREKSSQVKKKTAGNRKFASDAGQKNEEHISVEVRAMAALGIMVFVMMCNFHLCLKLGELVFLLLHGFFGCMAYVMPVVFFLVYILRLANESNKDSHARNEIYGRTFYLLLFFGEICCFIQLITMDETDEFSLVQYFTDGQKGLHGGLVGGFVAGGLQHLIGTVAAMVILVMVMIVTIIIFTDTSMESMASRSEKKMNEFVTGISDWFREFGNSWQKSEKKSVSEEESVGDDSGDETRKTGISGHQRNKTAGSGKKETAESGKDIADKSNNPLQAFLVKLGFGKYNNKGQGTARNTALKENVSLEKPSETEEKPPWIEERRSQMRMTEKNSDGIILGADEEEKSRRISSRGDYAMYGPWKLKSQGQENRTSYSLNDTKTDHNAEIKNPVYRSDRGNDSEYSGKNGSFFKGSVPSFMTNGTTGSSQDDKPVRDSGEKSDVSGEQDSSSLRNRIAGSSFVINVKDRFGRGEETADNKNQQTKPGPDESDHNNYVNDEYRNHPYKHTYSHGFFSREEKARKKSGAAGGSDSDAHTQAVTENEPDVGSPEKSFAKRIVYLENSTLSLDAMGFENLADSESTFADPVENTSIDDFILFNGSSKIQTSKGGVLKEVPFRESPDDDTIPEDTSEPEEENPVVDIGIRYHDAFTGKNFRNTPVQNTYPYEDNLYGESDDLYGDNDDLYRERGKNSYPGTENDTMHYENGLFDDRNPSDQKNRKEEAGSSRFPENGYVQKEDDLSDREKADAYGYAEDDDYGREKADAYGYPEADDYGPEEADAYGYPETGDYSQPGDGSYDLTKDVMLPDDEDNGTLSADKPFSMPQRRPVSKPSVPEARSAGSRMNQSIWAQPGSQSARDSSGAVRFSQSPAAQVTKEKEEDKPYVAPSFDCLNPKMGFTNEITEKHLETQQKLSDTLKSFNVDVEMGSISPGPAVTRYELQPNAGVKVARVVALQDDIKLALAASDIRIEAPIPGKSAIGIEVPNEESTVVGFRDLIESEAFKNSKSKIAFAVGRDLSGKIVVTDLAKMPHLLIAGATGSGKSVCINTIIMSILYKATPDQVKMIMIDPKVVELSVYNGIPHLLVPVVTDPKKASNALKWAVDEMDDRYKRFAQYNVRNLEGYNEAVRRSRMIDPDCDDETMYQMVIIVDELADLMMVAAGDVEEAICRLAQKARAAGIHLVLATQRPSVNVITGLIKANVPSRIAFAVSSGVDSRTIIDMNGAEKLLGKGDMLFYPYGLPKPTRVQGAFISDEEVSRVVDYVIRNNSGPSGHERMQEMITNAAQSNTAVQERDELFRDVGMFVIEKDKGSIGALQRNFRIGFNRAARIMDQLAEAGVVGPEEGTKPRKILMTLEQFNDLLNNE